MKNESPFLISWFIWDFRGNAYRIMIRIPQSKLKYRKIVLATDKSHRLSINPVNLLRQERHNCTGKSLV